MVDMIATAQRSEGEGTRGKMAMTKRKSYWKVEFPFNLQRVRI
jgi:hypothetical protein